MCAVLILGEVGKGDVCSTDIGGSGEGGCVQF